MTTTYYPQPSPAPRPFDRAFGGREFGYDEPRAVMHDNFPAAMPQPAGPSKTPSALRSGVMLLGAVAAVGAGVLIGVTLFGKDGSTSTPIQPVYLVPGADGESAAVVQTPTSLAPAPRPSPEGVALPGTDAVIVPPRNNGPVINVPLPANPNAGRCSHPGSCSASGAGSAGARPHRGALPGQSSPGTAEAANAGTAEDRPTEDRPENRTAAPGPEVGPRDRATRRSCCLNHRRSARSGPDDRGRSCRSPAEDRPDDDRGSMLPKTRPKGPGDTEVVLPKPVPAPPAPVPAPPEPTCDFFSC